LTTNGFRGLNTIDRDTDPNVKYVAKRTRSYWQDVHTRESSDRTIARKFNYR